MPLTDGGDSDEIGGRDETLRKTFCMLDIMDDRADPMRLEPPTGKDAEGVEFRVRREVNSANATTGQEAARGRGSLDLEGVEYERCCPASGTSEVEFGRPYTLCKRLAYRRPRRAASPSCARLGRVARRGSDSPVPRQENWRNAAQSARALPQRHRPPSDSRRPPVPPCATMTLPSSLKRKGVSNNHLSLQGKLRRTWASPRTKSLRGSTKSARTRARIVR